MRRVFSSRSETAHVWAQNRQSDGKSSDGRMFFERDRIYSYGRHFCMARILPSGAVAVTTRSYSSSTSKHQSHVSRAISHRKRVYCHDPDSSASSESEYVRERIASMLKDAAEKPRIRQTTRDSLRASALHLAEQFNEYLAELPKDEKKGVRPIDTSNLADVREELERQKKREAAARRLAEAKVAEKQREHLAEWRNGSDVWHNLYSLPPALRLKNDEVQTSHGAVISVEDAHRLWPMIQRVRRGDRDYEVGMDLGYYRLTKIRRDGSIIVGCHDIAYSEIERIAKALGLLDEVAA